MRIEVHIDRLVLDGLPIAPSDGARIRTAVQRELGRMLVLDGVSDRMRARGATDRLSAPRIRLSATHTPERIGREIAHSVYVGLGTSG
jgi:hypothetical protein